MHPSGRGGLLPAVLAWLASASAPAQAQQPEAEAAPAPAAAPAASPEAGRSVLVPPPTLSGEAPEHIAGALQEGVRAGLTDAGLPVVEAPEGCADTSCAAAAVAEGKASAYVRTEVSITGSDYALAVDMVDAEGRSLARKEGHCEICTYEEAAVALRELVAATASDLPPTEASVPPPTVDPEPEPPKRRMSPKTTQIAALTAIGVGVAALAGGIVLLVLDENPVKSNCSGPHVDADGDCEFRYSTLGGGIGLTVTGAVVAGGGVGLLLWSRKQAKGEPPAVSLVPWGVRARF
jgi:hypothetical protein